MSTPNFLCVVALTVLEQVIEVFIVAVAPVHDVCYDITWVVSIHLVEDSVDVLYTSLDALLSLANSGVCAHYILQYDSEEGLI